MISILERSKTMGKFVIKKTSTGIKFDLKAGNGEVIATSEVYTTEEACKKGIESVRSNASANVEDQTEKTIQTISNPKYELFTDKGGEFRFRLKARNGSIIAASEGYKTKSACANGIESVKKNAPDATVEKV